MYRGASICFQCRRLWSTSYILDSIFLVVYQWDVSGKAASVKRHYFINNKYLGSTEVPANTPAYSNFFYCWSCGEVYARTPLDTPGQWIGNQGCCEKCPPMKEAWRQLPGSIWHSYAQEQYWPFPDEVLKREFWIAINWEAAGWK